MSNLKDTDIDDLFRRASDKYPLRTDGADWDRMAAALENKGPEPPDGPLETEEKRKKRRFFWLFFLLLPLAGAGYYTWHQAGKINNAGNAVASGKTANPVSADAPAIRGANTTPGANAMSGKPHGSHIDNDNVTENQEDQPENSLSLAAAHARQQPGGEAGAGARRSGARRPDADRPSADRSNASRPGVDRPDAGRLAANGSAANRSGANDPDANAPGGNGTGGNAPGVDAPGVDRTGANGSPADSLLAGGPATEDRLFYDLQRAPISRDYRVAVNVTAPAAQKDSTKAKAKTKHFYAGILASPDLSTVKMQSVKGVGTTFGVVLGYTFNGGRWAVETGAYLDRKKYYSEGEYFSTKEIPLPPNSWLTDVDGICYMWEIPVNLRYNFNPGAKTSWFATAGFSTYLMTREKYTYGLEWPGSTRPYDSKWNFHKSSQYPFSIINLSAGFEQRLGKIGNLRVEPYVRLPLTGLGTGKLPIMSAGVNIGITRQLW